LGGSTFGATVVQIAAEDFARVLGLAVATAGGDESQRKRAGQDRK
jgi:hypothetical protein